MAIDKDATAGGFTDPLELMLSVPATATATATVVGCSYCGTTATPKGRRYGYLSRCAEQ